MSHDRQPFLGISWLYSQYMWVWAALLILTVVEVLVPEPSLIGLSKMSRSLTVLSLIILALMKTFFVAYYYMHLIDEKPSIILIACAPFIFSVFLTIGIWPQRSQKGSEVKQKQSSVRQIDSKKQATASAFDQPDNSSETRSSGSSFVAHPHITSVAQINRN